MPAFARLSCATLAAFFIATEAQPLSPPAGIAHTCDLTTLENRITALNDACCVADACYTSLDTCSIDCAIVLFPLLSDCRSILDNLYDGVDGTYDGVAYTPSIPSMYAACARGARL